ncbi:MAG: subclass B3 metallo-beta-lactamase [Tsuneonella sp.]
MFGRSIMIAALLLAGCAAPQAVTPAEHSPLAWAAACQDGDDWDKPGPPYRIAAHTYYVGTCGITSVLIVGPEGHTLIDSGTDKGAQVVLANIRQLGFDPRDVKTILMSHEHFDHVGGMARLQAATGATIVATREAADVLRSGKVSRSDPQAHSGHPPFPAVTGPVVVLDQERPQLSSDREFTPLFTHGHTLGATSWTWEDASQDVSKRIVYADSLNPISADDYRFSDHPELLAAFRAGLAKIAALDRCLLITPHPSASGMRDRLRTWGLAMAGRHDCREYAAKISARLDERLAKERNGG